MEKKQYNTPILKVYGDVKEITKASGDASDPIDNIWQSGTDDEGNPVWSFTRGSS